MPDVLGGVWLCLCVAGVWKDLSDEKRCDMRRECRAER